VVGKLLPLLGVRWQFLAVRRAKLLRMTMRGSMRAQFFSATNRVLKQCH
jgi:hypothetical protein